ncbi:MAG TPA: hypothetical protein PKX16_10310, partial [Kiritimatiellia bacterium]|nr:hypothetical protein [Kiritimatiellia bacterium]
MQSLLRGRKAAALVSAAALLLLLFPENISSDGNGWHPLGSSMHVVIFAGLAWIWGRSVPVRLRGWTLWAALAVVSAGVEGLQPHLGRSAELADWLYGVGGAACVCSTWHHRRRFQIRWAAVGALCLFPLAWDMGMARMEIRAFPVLADPGARWARRGWTWNSTYLVGASDEGLRVKVDSTLKNEGLGAYPGLFREPAGSDWRAARSFRADVFWAAEVPAILAVRVDDRPGNPPYAERFQREFAVTQGWNSVQIPAEELGRASGGRPLNLEKIRR